MLPEVTRAQHALRRKSATCHPVSGLDHGQCNTFGNTNARARPACLSLDLPIGVALRTVLAMESAGSRDVHGGAKRLSYKMARLPVVGHIPVHGLVFDFLQGGLPASPLPGSLSLGG